MSEASKAALDEALAQLREAGFDADVLGMAAAETSLDPVPAPRQEAAFASLTPETIKAAISGSYLPSELGFTSGETGTSPELTALLAQSDVVLTGAQRAWQLKPEARRSILIQARNEGRLQSALPVDTRSDDLDGLMLQRVVARELFVPETMPLDDLKRFAVVSGWVRGSDLADVPPKAELNSVLKRRELLEPFRLLVGRPLEAGPDGSRDRVVGRSKEIEHLRAYVGIVPPEELRQHVSRALSSLWSSVTFRDNANEPMLVRGLGGMGKSTLLAKFILDHALYPGMTLPFAYLDFDRAALAPRQPLQLLIDIALQLGLWLPQCEAELKKLRGDLRKAIDVQAGSETQRVIERSTRSALKTFCEKLRRIVEGATLGRAPVLLIFDTFEVVQYDAEAVESLVSLIGILRKAAETSWNNLRLVVAGRVAVPEINTGQKPVVLGRLTIAATEQLIRQRNTADDLGLTDVQIKALAKPLRNSPLDVVIVANWLRDREPAERAMLATDIAAEAAGDVSDDDKQELTARRVTGILINRMIKHIKNDEVRKLADPGLVVRLVTPEVIRSIMAPACGLIEKPEDLPEKAEELLFARLKAERWLVEPLGNALRHRPEVRLAMLDLMRRKDKDLFETTNRRAIDFFRERMERDIGARAAAIYHMLLAGEPLEQVDQLWQPGCEAALSGAVDDLDGKWATYLKARLGRQVDPAELRLLPDTLIVSVLKTYGARILRRVRPPMLADFFSGNAAADSEPSLLGLKAETLYRAGRWGALLDWEQQAVATAPQNQAAKPLQFGAVQQSIQRGDVRGALMLDKEIGKPLGWLFRWMARDARADAIVARLNLPEFADRLVGQFNDEDASWPLAVLAVCLGRRMPSLADAGEQCLGRIGQLCQSGKIPVAANATGSLRVLAFLEDQERRTILPRVDFKGHFSTVAAMETKVFGELLSIAATTSDFSDGPVSPNEWSATLVRGKSVLERLRSYPETAVIADAEVTESFASIVESLALSRSPRISPAILRLLALTHPDWVEPLGHALTRARDGGRPDTLWLWMQGLQFFGARRSAIKEPTGYDILARADEACRLNVVVDSYAMLMRERGNNPDAKKFLELAGLFQTWRGMLLSAAGIAEPHSPIA